MCARCGQLKAFAMLDATGNEVCHVGIPALWTCPRQVSNEDVCKGLRHPPRFRVLQYQAVD